MDWLDVLLCPEVAIGIVVGVLAAGVLRWLAPDVPGWFNAGLVAAGFLVGLAVAFASGRGANDK
jgi:hypothetical protein